ncbi:MAG: hypothetical protein IAE79_28180 [Anaerolinea sp.]|nr:hypothetical protein [Anaerolinea sp.]
MAEKESKRIVRKGNDLFREVQRPDNDEIWLVANWDLWFLVVLLNEFDGDWQKMINHLRHHISNHDTIEAQLSHLRHLQETMQQAGLDPISVLGPEAMALLKKEKRQAANKILKQELPWNDKSYWMIHTPRYVREERSRRGYWPHFAVSPEIYAQPLAALFKTHGYYEEDQSFALERKLSAHLDKQEKKASVPQLAALYRAFLTVMLEKIEIVDDSYGVIGDLYGDVLTGYMGLPRDEIGVPLPIFLQDLVELVVWEDYGFTDDEVEEFMASLSPEEASMMRPILRDQWSELAALDLPYQAEKALTLLGLLAVEQEWFSQFVELAQEMGARAWQRIVRMADKAEQAGQLDLATAVYETALLAPGLHHDYLQKKYQELQARTG